MYAEPTRAQGADHRATRCATAPHATAADATADLQRLFKSYDAACFDFDADAVAAFYELPCLISTPDGNGSFTARGELRMAFARVFSGYRCQGLAAASIVSLQLDLLSAAIAQARVIWSLSNARGADIRSLACAYTLRRSQGKWRIACAVALDEQGLRKAALSLPPRI